MANTFCIENGEVKSIASSKTKNGGNVYRAEIYDPNEDCTDWIGLGFDEPPFGEGGVINIEVEENGKYLNGLPDSIEVIEEGNKASGRGGRSGSSRGGRGNNDSGSSRSGRSGGSDGGSSRGSSGRGAAAKSPARGASKPAAKGKESGGTDWEAKDKRAQLGFAREQAIKVLDSLIDKGAVKLGAKVADQYDNYLLHLNKLTARFLEESDRYLEEGVAAIDSDADDGAEEE